MPSFRSFLLLAVPILVGLFVTRSPFMMASTAPSESKPWADGPMKLIPTPQYATKKVCGPRRSPSMPPGPEALGLTAETD